MSAVMTFSAEFQPFDPAQDDSSTEPETGLEEPTWEPPRVHVPRALVWAILISFVLLVVVLSIWGFAHGTWCIDCP